jgi:pimeloyl-ACP methyl ester carboxylesterase
VLVGESIGGVLALTASPELPGRVARVYSLNPYDYGESFGGEMRRSRFGFIVALFAVFGPFTPELRGLLSLVLAGGVVNERALPSHLLSHTYSLS